MPAGASKKLVLTYVDSLRTDMLERAVAEQRAPTFGALLERGVLVPDCVSSFPSVTPVACSEIVTGVGADRHWISGMNWYHRLERRYVEYGSSLDATRSVGVFRALYDLVYNMNLSHLSPEVETLFERLDDAGARTACTPFLIYRGRHRHQVSLDGLMRRAVDATRLKFRHHTWGPTELFYGDLYASRAVPCKSTSIPGMRDPYSACCAAELVKEDLFDFLLFSLRRQRQLLAPPRARGDGRVDRQGRPVLLERGRGGGRARRLPRPLRPDPRRRPRADRRRPRPAAGRAARPRVVGAGPVRRPARAGAARGQPDRPRRPRLPAPRRGRAGRPRRGAPAPRRHRRASTWSAGWRSDGAAPSRARRSSRRRRARRAPALRARRRGPRPARRGWDLDGDPGVLLATVEDGRLRSEEYPDPLARVFSALRSPHAGDFVVSLAPGYEAVDWGGVTHAGGGSHGALHRGDSLGPLLFVGCGPAAAAEREQWTLRDVAPAVLEHFGL